MERSSKHGARMDDAMADEAVESRVEESREKEPVDTVPDDDIELRSELAKNLRMSAFPANRQTLEQIATEEQAPNHILALIRRLPDGQTFQNNEEVWRAVKP